MTSPLDTLVFVVENGEIIEGPIRDFSGFIEETTTPHGIGPVLHVRGTELWTWGHQGSFPRKLREFSTEQEAQDALEESFVHDFWNCDSICAFATREEAEQFLANAA